MEDNNMIKIENGKYKYFDKNGKEILENCVIRYPYGRERIVYRTVEDELGIDATNPKWIESGRAVPCEWGIYPLEIEETDMVEVVCYDN
jgi:hypothetical protein